MEINKRIEEARKSMKKHKVDAYIVTSSDYHQSEYIGEYFQGRQYLSGFTGSAGILVIFNDEACLLIDFQLGYDIFHLSIGKPRH